MGMIMPFALIPILIFPMYFMFFKYHSNFKKNPIVSSHFNSIIVGPFGTLIFNCVKRPRHFEVHQMVLGNL